MFVSTARYIFLSSILLSSIILIVQGRNTQRRVTVYEKNETHVYPKPRGVFLAHPHVNNSTKMTISPTNTSATRNMVSSNLIYNGGPVLSNVKVVLILWGGSSNVRFGTQLQQFYAAVTSSSWYSIMKEYKTSKQSIGSGSLIYTYSDASAPTGTLTQATIESRLKTLISTGKVPTPDINTYYAIHFASGTKPNDTCMTSGGGTVCGWHSMTYSSSTNQAVYYGSMPDQVGCGYCDSGNPLSDIYGLSSHELAEAVTDPDVSSGWYDANGEEIADVCDSIGATVGSDGLTYAVQFLWSNTAGKCISGVASPIPAPIPSPVQVPNPVPVRAPAPAPTPISTSTPFRTKAGPIRSLFGRCVDVSGANFANGVQLQIWDCNGSAAQQWIRPSSTDLRLQAPSSNLCMDTYGNADAGGAVVLSPCSNNVSSQKWLFDGRNLHPSHNPNLCLSIGGGTSSNGVKLIVSLCDNGSNSAWVEYSLSPVYGTIPSGVTRSHYLCPVGSGIINISGRGGSWVDQLVATCGDGTKTVLGPVGGNGGSVISSPACVSGYRSVKVISGTYVGQINATCSGSSTSSAVIGKGWSSGSGSSNTLQLGSNQWLIGLQVYSTGSYVNAISLLYGPKSSSTAPVPSPIPAPVLAPAPVVNPVSAPASLPTSSSLDGAWLQAHNVRRQKYQTMYGVSYVPLKWSTSIATSAQGYANKLIAISGCVIQHGYQGDSYGGENLAAFYGSGSSDPTPDQVLTLWTENEASSIGGHFTQVIWRGTHYVGCAMARKTGCHIQVCRYIAPGNCNLSSSNWQKTTFADSSPCGPQCPAEGCL